MTAWPVHMGVKNLHTQSMLQLNRFCNNIDRSIDRYFNKQSIVVILVSHHGMFRHEMFHHEMFHHEMFYHEMFHQPFGCPKLRGSGRWFVLTM